MDLRLRDLMISKNFERFYNSRRPYGISDIDPQEDKKLPPILAKDQTLLGAEENTLISSTALRRIQKDPSILTKRFEKANERAEKPLFPKEVMDKLASEPALTEMEKLERAQEKK